MAIRNRPRSDLTSSPIRSKGSSSRTSSPTRDRVSSSRISNPIQLIPAKARRVIRASLRIQAVARPVEAQPLPPPPGASVAPAPGQAPQRLTVGADPTGAAAGRDCARAGEFAATRARCGCRPPEDDTVVEAPTPHIDNGRAVFSGLDKITGRTTSFDAAIGETVQFGALQVTPRACYTRPATEATNTDAFVEVDEVTLQGDIKRIFTGWMFASSPRTACRGASDL